MKKCFFLLPLSLLLFGCATHKAVPEKVYIDSVRTEVRTVTEFVTDTVYFEVPAQTAERTVRDSLSSLENDYAVSTARLMPDGTLHHTLATKRQRKAVEFQKPVERRDSIVYRDRIKTETKVKTVERELTWWQKTRIYGFYVLLGLLLIKYLLKIISLARGKIKW